ncbi:MAG TPA: 30S ribosomal protein S6 [Actinomycetota bacterium]|jgi:small subunit ribosomal protein S6
MRSYEAMVIVDARLEEGDIQKAVDKFSAAVGDNGGHLSNLDRWGNRRFAFEINHQNEGYYFVASFTAPQAAIEPLQRILQISDEFIRGKIVQLGPAAGNGAGKGAKGKE